MIFVLLLMTGAFTTMTSLAVVVKHSDVVTEENLHRLSKPSDNKQASVVRDLKLNYKLSTILASRGQVTAIHSEGARRKFYSSVVEVSGSLAELFYRENAAHRARLDHLDKASCGWHNLHNASVNSF